MLNLREGIQPGLGAFNPPIDFEKKNGPHLKYGYPMINPYDNAMINQSTLVCV